METLLLKFHVDKTGLHENNVIADIINDLSGEMRILLASYLQKIFCRQYMVDDEILASLEGMVEAIKQGKVRPADECEEKTKEEIPHREHHSRDPIRDHDSKVFLPMKNGLIDSLGEDDCGILRLFDASDFSVSVNNWKKIQETRMGIRACAQRFTFIGNSLRALEVELEQNDETRLGETKFEIAASTINRLCRSEREEIASFWETGLIVSVERALQENTIKKSRHDRLLKRIEQHANAIYSGRVAH